MKRIIVSSNVLQIYTQEETTPPETDQQDKQAEKPQLVELTERVQKLVNKAKLNPDILVYR